MVLVMVYSNIPISKRALTLPGARNFVICVVNVLLFFFLTAGRVEVVWVRVTLRNTVSHNINVSGSFADLRSLARFVTTS